MKFDESKVYTALNADELLVGSKCIFAATIKSLKNKVEANKTPTVLIALNNEDCTARFEDTENLWFLAYLVELPTSLTHKPYSTIKKAVTAIKKHGGWVKFCKHNEYALLTGYNESYIYLDSNSATLEELFTDTIFADDGTPCGELAEGAE